MTTYYIIRRGWNAANQSETRSLRTAKNTFESRLDMLVEIVQADSPEDAVNMCSASVYANQSLLAVSSPRSIKGLTREIRRCAWRGQVAAAIASPEGQAFLLEMAAAMDAMRHRWLICDELIDEDGDCCAIGAVCKARGIDTAGIDDDGMECVAERLGVPWPLMAEIVDRNDGFCETLAARWQRMRKWVDRHITREGGT